MNGAAATIEPITPEIAARLLGRLVFLPIKHFDCRTDKTRRYNRQYRSISERTMFYDVLDLGLR
jgi:hypothetical protein